MCTPSRPGPCNLPQVVLKLILLPLPDADKVRNLEACVLKNQRWKKLYPQHEEQLPTYQKQLLLCSAIETDGLSVTAAKH